MWGTACAAGSGWREHLLFGESHKLPGRRHREACRQIHSWKAKDIPARRAFPARCCVTQKARGGRQIAPSESLERANSVQLPSTIMPQYLSIEAVDHSQPCLLPDAI